MTPVPPPPPPVRVPVPDGALAELTAIVGTAHVLRDADLRAGYEQDWTGRFHGATTAVVRPASTEEVAACLAVCDRHGVAVVPQGGNTGLVGGGVPLAGEVVLNLRRLDRLEPVAILEGQVTAGAGVTLAALQRHVAPAGLLFAVDLAARDSATIGGMVATNAGGLHVLRHGAMRAQVLGIEAVLASGAVLRHLGGLVKDNTGYDLAQIVCGSEGTLAVVTAARLRLIPQPRHRVTALVGMRSVAEAVDAVVTWRRSVPELEAAELVLGAGVALVCERFGWPPPLAQPWPVVVVLEAAGPEDPTDRLAGAIGDHVAVGDVAVATDEARRRVLWRYREEQTAAINLVGTPHKLDVTLPLERVAAFVDEVPDVVAAADPNATTWLFGHLGDGNIHVNITGVADDDEGVDDAVLRLVVDRGGSISAEHGIGTAKRRWLTWQRSPTEIAAFRAIKDALDPNGILNPNVLLPPR
jgi:FAD/FMN-containing dehydrogenase